MAIYDNKLELKKLLCIVTKSGVWDSLALGWDSQISFGTHCRWNTALRFLETIKDIDMKVTPLIKRHEINLLLLSYLSCGVT